MVQISHMINNDIDYDPEANFMGRLDKASEFLKGTKTIIKHGEINLSVAMI